ncbi:uncharacterized protein LOC105190474 [Harpegnathos saltator]|uniref:uncharacterized protein LOC105190474 n=1 Tax=Harpegnathos saltator TaxID=610380 RepID=UPI000DBEDE90|nr:uncharacterized protein LOC105190474 [Harpegnathos saltator]
MPKIRKNNENSPSGWISATEQRAYIRSETVRGKKVPEIHAALKEAYRRFTVNRSTVQRWHTKFREGRTSIEDDPRAGQPSTVTADNTNASIIATLLDEDRRITVLGKRKAARWVPHFLSAKQKATRSEIAHELLACYENEGETFLDRIIAIDETWIRDFEPELKSQSDVWKSPGSPRAQKVRRQQSKMKEIMIFAYDKQGVITTDQVPRDTSVTGAYYKNFLQNVLRPKIRKLRPGMLQSGVLILHDNARPYIGAPIIELLEKYGWERLRHPAYSPDLSPPDFDLFPKMKEPLRGVRFPTLEVLRREVTRQIRMLNKNGTLNSSTSAPLASVH